jgi:photosystem II stability/assembly factor-like uncharacterized protein
MPPRWFEFWGSALIAAAGAIGVGCSSGGGAGQAHSGTGGSPGGAGSGGVDGGGGGSSGGGASGDPLLPACAEWPEPRGPAFSLPPRAPRTVELVRRSASGRTLYGFGRWTNGGQAQRGLLRSNDEGRSWCPLAMPVPLAVVTPAPADDLTLWALADPASAGAVAREIFRSVDGGASWQAVRGDLPAGVYPTELLRVGPSGRDVAWVRTSEAPNGAAFTRDGGRTWTRLSLFDDPAPGLLSLGVSSFVDPALPNRILAWSTTYDVVGAGAVVQRIRGSVDWGVTWSDRVSPDPSLSLAIGLLGSTSTLYAIGAVNSIWRSRDWGASWQPAPPLPEGGGGGRLIAAEGAGGAGHVVLVSVDSRGLFETVDGGEAWRAIPPPADVDKGYALVSAGPGAGQLLVSTSIGLQATADGGATWIAQRPQPASASSVAVSPADPMTIWATTSGETLRSSDGGRTWRAIERSRRFVEVAPDPADARAAFAVDLVARAVFATDDGGETWRTLAATRATPRHVMMAPDGTVLYAVTDAGIESSDNRGTLWSHVLDVDVLPSVGLQLAVSPADGHHAVVLAAQRSGSDSALVVETRDAGASAARMVAIPGLAGQVQFTSIAFAGDGVLLVGGQSGILRSSDGGATWSAANDGIDPGAPRALPGAPILAILAPSASPGEVWAVGGALFRSIDAGLAWASWPGPVASLPIDLRGLSVVAGDPRPGGRLLALGLSEGASTGPAGGNVVATNLAVLELRP